MYFYLLMMINKHKLQRLSYFSSVWLIFLILFIGKIDIFQRIWNASHFQFINDK